MTHPYITIAYQPLVVNFNIISKKQVKRLLKVDERVLSR